MFRQRVSKERRQARPVGRSGVPTAEQAFADLLQSRLLRSHRLSRNCEIGPFVADYVFSEASLVIELHCLADPLDRHSGARDAFVRNMGYRILRVSEREVLLQPRRVLARIRAALSARDRVR